MKKSMLSGWSSIPGGILFFGDYVYMYTRVHALSRSIVCLTQTEPSLIVQENKCTFGGACFSLD